MEASLMAKLKKAYRTQYRHTLTPLALSVVAEGSRPNCVVPELEAVLGKTHRTEF
jgi:hypothetical protein